MKRNDLDNLPAWARAEAHRQLAKQDATTDAVLAGVAANQPKRRRLNAPPCNDGNKYGAVRTTVDGISFASKAEAEHYSRLCLLMKAGEVAWFCRQPRFVLEGGVEYVADFIVQYNAPHLSAVIAPPHVEVQDCKGMDTPVYILKRKQVKARYGIKIVEIHK